MAALALSNHYTQLQNITSWANENTGEGTETEVIDDQRYENTCDSFQQLILLFIVTVCIDAVTGKTVVSWLKFGENI